MNFPPIKYSQSVRVISLVLSLLPFSAFSQQNKEIGFTSSVISRRLNMGETGSLFIKITNAEDPGLPMRIDVPGLDVIRTSKPSFSSSMINGVIVGSEFIYEYQIRPTAPGNYTIPPMTAQIRGKNYITQPIQITVVQAKTDGLAAAATQPIFGRFNLDVKEAYVNQLIPFDIAVFVRGRNAISDVSSAKLTHESFVFQNFREVKLDGMELNGNLYSLARLPANLFALKAGDHTVGPCEVVVSTLDSKSSFGFGIFQRTSRKRIVTGTATLKIKPLPPGAPPSFTGGVGDFELSGKPSTTSITVGDPLSMNFEVKGIGNLGSLGAPHFSEKTNIALWKTYDPGKSLDSKENSDGLTSGKCTFSQVIIPLKETSEIPPFELTFFDPAKEQYITKRTTAIPITVLPEVEGLSTTTIAFPSNGVSENGASKQSYASRPTPQFSDVLHIRTMKPKWQSYTAIVPGSRGGPLYFTFHFLCSLGFFTLLGFGILRWFKSRKIQNESKTTFKQSLKSIPKPGTPKREFYHAVSTSLDLWKSEHRNAPEKVLQAIKHLTEKCDTILYAGEKVVDAPLSESEELEFLSILKKLPTK